jgi:hypothetical protein
MSSANRTDLTVLLKFNGKSFIYKRKRSGPRMEPCGTPGLTVFQLEHV